MDIRSDTFPPRPCPYLIALLANDGMELEAAVERMCYQTGCEYGACDEKGFCKDFTLLINKARQLAEADDVSDLEAISELGEGWVAEEALAISVFCALRYSDDFEKAMIAAVNHDGDSDSTGAITGNILGAYMGIESIPERFQRNLELRDIILEIADDLSNDCPLNSWDMKGTTEEEKRWENKYWYNNKNYKY